MDNFNLNLNSTQGQHFVTLSAVLINRGLIVLNGWNIVLNSTERFPCRLFNSSDGLNKGQIDFTFSRHGFKNWHKATTKFNHQKSKSHINSIILKTNYLSLNSIDIASDESSIMAINQREKERLQNLFVLHRLIDITHCLAKS